MIPASGLGRRLRRLLAPALDRAAATPGADRYRTHFPRRAHRAILLCHVLAGAASLRQPHARLAATGFAGWDLPAGISFSQLARSSPSRDPAGVARLFADVVATARGRTDPSWHQLTRIQAVDSACVALSATLSPWSQHGGHVPGVRLQTGFALADAIPAALDLTLADTHDTTAVRTRALPARAGWTVRIDRGSSGHRRFAELRAAGVSFLCPRQPQASSQGTADHRVPPITPPMVTSCWPTRRSRSAPPPTAPARCCPACASSPAATPTARSTASSPIGST